MQKKYLALALLVILFLTGCAGKPGVSTLIISKEGEVKSYIIEEFAAPYYDAEELKSNVLNDILHANEQLKQTAIELTSYELVEGVLSATIEYQSAKAYEDFNEETLYVGLWEEAVAEGYKIDAAIENDNYHIVIFTEPVDVKVPKKIVYVSDGLQKTGKKTVTVTDREKEIYYIIHE